MFSFPRLAARMNERIARLGVALAALERGDHAACAALADDLRARDPGDREATLLAGLAHGALGDAPHAAALLDAVARGGEAGTTGHPVRDLIGVLRAAGHEARIPDQLAACVALAPDCPRLRYAEADWLHGQGDLAAADRVLARALASADDFAPLHHLRAIVLADLGETQAAIGHAVAALARDPREASVWSNLGTLLKTAGRFEEAHAAHNEAVSRAPDDPRLRVNRAVTLLRAGRLAEAWADYEHRLRLPGRAPPSSAPLLPDLAGPHALPPGALAGRRVLVTHEDGFGDTIQFCRYLPLLLAQGATVFALVPPPLARLLRAMAVIVQTGEALPPHDYQCPFTSLPRAFATTLETIPAKTPYLAPDPSLVAAWSRRLPPEEGKARIGLVWAGQARPWEPGFEQMDRRRSLNLAALAPLAAVPATFVSLQLGPQAAQAACPPPGMALHDPTGDIADFANTAAIVANLDAVISVDTAVAHLAGALGVPVLLLDRHDACWRWLAGRTDSPWYPTLRIFRQDRAGDWDGPIRAAAEAAARIPRS
jgi:tetratricopeptide (TPR) repeat protein